MNNNLKKVESQFERVQVVSRSSIPVLKSIQMGDHTHEVGLVHDFRKNPHLKDFMPENGRYSVSWVHLNKEQMLAVHLHPTPGLVIVAEGEGMVIGELNQIIRPGDIVAVPSNCEHGFIGKGDKGFWALAIQFEGLGIYEDVKNPRLDFVKKTSAVDLVSLLEKDQVGHQKRFKKGALMKLVTSKRAQEKDVQDRLLEALNFWSDWFQRILAARVAAGNPGVFQEMAEHHFAEEIGHNHTLLKMRNETPVAMWDPILDATASWFYQRVVSSTAEERTILMHCVLEAASCIFHSSAQSIFPKADHFSLHSELDQEHAQEGFDILKTTGVKDIDHLRKVLSEGWQMAEHLTGSMARYALRG
ncbi:MAG: cupin domain-containing protein [Janthinobacterium lividum]